MNKICLRCQKEFEGGRKSLYCSNECKGAKPGRKNTEQQPDIVMPKLAEKLVNEPSKTQSGDIPITKRMTDPPVGSNAWKLRNGKFD